MWWCLCERHVPSTLQLRCAVDRSSKDGLTFPVSAWRMGGAVLGAVLNPSVYTSRRATVSARVAECVGHSMCVLLRKFILFTLSV